MKDSKRETLLRTMTEDMAILLGGTDLASPLRELAPKGRSFATVAVDKLEEYAEGWPAGGGDGRGGGDENGRTFSLAATHADKGTTETTIRDFDSFLTVAAEMLHRASDIATKAVVPINAAPAKAKDNPDDWCASCARLRDHKNRPFAVPSAQVPKSPQLVRRTPDGIEHAGKALCQWCYGWTLGENEWPPLPLIEKRRDGVRITNKVLTELGVTPRSDTHGLSPDLVAPIDVVTSV